MGVCRPVLQILTHFRPKNVILHTVFRPGPGCSNIRWRYPPDKSRKSIIAINYAMRWIVIYPVGSAIKFWTTGAWGSLLERPGNFSGQKSNIQIEI